MLSKKFTAVAGAAAEVADDYFENVTMLLHGDGTDGAQNNTFTDSSSNNFTITPNGNTTKGTFSPYGSNWSNYFDGSGDYLLAPSTSGQLGSGDFTIECWSYLTAKVSSYPCIWGNYTSFGAGSLALFAGHNSGTTTKYNVAINGTFPAIQSSDSIVYNQWTHLALVRSGTTITLYVNGVANGSATSSATLNGTSGTSYIGTAGDDVANGYIQGYLSNIRVVVGTAVYTSGFTPSTSPLTAITNTKLITCQSNRFIDNSSNAFTITVNGNTSVQRFSPFNPTSAYSTSTIGGSGYFDGSGDYLLTAASSNLEFGSGDFTIEFWWYPTATGRQALYCGSFGTDYSIGIDYSSVSPYNSQTIGIWASSNGSSWNLINADGGGNGIGTITIKQKAWNHIAFVRSGTSWMLLVNGVRDLNITGLSGTLVDRSSAQKAIGSWFSTGAMAQPSGYISDFRITKGGALYTGATYIVPTAPLTTTVSSGTVQLLTSMTNAGIYDNAMMNDLETVGNARISTSVKKYGTGSMYFDGTGDYLICADSPNLTYGTGDFTVEAWIYPTSTPSNQVFIDQREASPAGGGFSLECGSDLKPVVATSVAVITSSTAMTINTWNHVAYSRSGTSLKLFLNGTQVGSATNSSNLTSQRFTLGAYTSRASSYAFGYIDDLRITKGVARYTSNFTAPTAALPDK